LSVDYTDEEIKNIILVEMNHSIMELEMPENGVELKNLVTKLGWEYDFVKQNILTLRDEGLIGCQFDNIGGGRFFVTLAEHTIERLDGLNQLTIRETAKLILEKAYDFYCRFGYDSSVQLQSDILGSCIGVSNTVKIDSAIELLGNEGLLKDFAVMLGKTIFMISTNGIDTVEKDIIKRKNNESKEFDMETKKRQTVNNVFLVHGRNDGTKAEVAAFLMKMKLKPIILHEQPNLGRTVIEKIEKYADVNAAVVLFTFDDFGRFRDEGADEPRARQNVIFEAGYFVGKLGRENTIILYEEGLTIPSDLSGYVYIQLDEKKRWHIELARELRAIGLDVNADNLIA